MSISFIRLSSTALFYVVIFVTGFWLNHAGKPYSVLLTTFHKLLSAGLIVFLVVTVIKINRVSALDTVEIIICAAAGLFFLGLLATGGLIIGGNEMPAIITRLHQILPYLAVVSTAVFICMQVRGN